MDLDKEELMEMNKNKDIVDTEITNLMSEIRNLQSELTKKQAILVALTESSLSMGKYIKSL